MKPYDRESFFNLPEGTLFHPVSNTMETAGQCRVFIKGPVGAQREVTDDGSILYILEASPQDSPADKMTFDFSDHRILTLGPNGHGEWIFLPSSTTVFLVYENEEEAKGKVLESRIPPADSLNPAGHRMSFEERLVAAAGLPNSLVLNGFEDWDGQLEVGRCVQVTEAGDVERIDNSDDKTDWIGEPFYSVYLHQNAGGVACVADFPTEGEAIAFAAALHLCRIHGASRQNQNTEADETLPDVTTMQWHEGKIGNNQANIVTRVTGKDVGIAYVKSAYHRQRIIESHNEVVAKLRQSPWDSHPAAVLLEQILHSLKIKYTSKAVTETTEAGLVVKAIHLDIDEDESVQGKIVRMVFSNKDLTFEHLDIIDPVAPEMSPLLELKKFESGADCFDIFLGELNLTSDVWINEETADRMLIVLNKLLDSVPRLKTVE